MQFRAMLVSPNLGIKVFELMEERLGLLFEVYFSTSKELTAFVIEPKSRAVLEIVHRLPLAKGLHYETNATPRG